MGKYLHPLHPKSLICKKKEDALRRLIQDGAGETKLLNAASAVRDARVRVIKASYARLSPPCAELQQKIALEIQSAGQTALGSILAEFHAIGG